MNFFWLDASAGIKRYVVEGGSPLINHLFARVPLDKMFCLLEGVGEIISIIVRIRNRGKITIAGFNQAKQLFDNEIIHRNEVQLVLATEDQITDSWDLIEKHFINSTDAILLQCALDRVNELRIEGDNLVLVSSDKRLIRAAQSEGLLIFNPETNSQAALDVLIDPP
ncbi:MAG: type II toxin-antitoxin system VapC family toxin [Candidatus Poribacteria bacterium]|nr:type II toxin-antitoxin system VapC family toxin [Candidatus Poribacteria bacterium]